MITLYVCLKLANYFDNSFTDSCIVPKYQWRDQRETGKPKSVTQKLTVFGKLFLCVIFVFLHPLPQVFECNIHINVLVGLRIKEVTLSQHCICYKQYQ